MSGSSFNYLCNVSPETLLEGGHSEELESMLAELEELSGGAVAADDTRALIEDVQLLRQLVEATVGANLQQLSPVWRAVEWWRSGDSSQQAAVKAAGDYGRTCNQPEMLKKRLAALRLVQEKLSRRIAELASGCSHQVEAGDSESARCSICGADLGWKCPDSPTGACRYEDDPDQCIHCGHPEERK